MSVAQPARYAASRKQHYSDFVFIAAERPGFSLDFPEGSGCVKTRGILNRRQGTVQGSAAALVDGCGPIMAVSCWTQLRAVSRPDNP